MVVVEVVMMVGGGGGGGSQAKGLAHWFCHLIHARMPYAGRLLTSTDFEPDWVKFGPPAVNIVSVDGTSMFFNSSI